MCVGRIFRLCIGWCGGLVEGEFFALFSLQAYCICLVMTLRACTITLPLHATLRLIAQHKQSNLMLPDVDIPVASPFLVTTSLFHHFTISPYYILQLSPLPSITNPIHPSLYFNPSPTSHPFILTHSHSHSPTQSNSIQLNPTLTHPAPAPSNCSPKATTTPPTTRSCTRAGRRTSPAPRTSSAAWSGTCRMWAM